MNVRETQHRLRTERLKRFLNHDDEAVARLAAVGWMLLIQHKVNKQGKCQLCFRARPSWWPKRRRMCTVHSAFTVGMEQPEWMVAGMNGDR